MSYWIGLMSGTSMDGIDAALVDASGKTLIAGMTCPYRQEAREALMSVLSTPTHPLGALHQLNTLLGIEFAQAVKTLLAHAGVDAASISAIGSHGQTLAHNMKSTIPYTIQLGCAHTIVEHTGISVVADFRTRDVVLGGQGAPFAPLYHQALFGQHHAPMAIVNLGGIANITYLGHHGALLGGHDVGPGNCLMDAWAVRHLGKAFDEGGVWAAKGRVLPSLLNRLLSDAFYTQKPPKSLCTSSYSLANLAPYLSDTWLPEDVQATFLALTVSAITQDLNHFQQHNMPLKHVIVCGGGARNTTLMLALQEALPRQAVQSSTEWGVDADYLESMMMAWLASNMLKGICVDLGKITGAKKPALLGAFYPSSAGVARTIS